MSVNISWSLFISVPKFSPETQTYIKKLEDERREKERGKGKDNRSFFAKYVSCTRGNFVLDQSASNPIRMPEYLLLLVRRYII